jgi:uncharacterized protein with gpF-like domain
MKNRFIEDDPTMFSVIQPKAVKAITKAETAVPASFFDLDPAEENLKLRQILAPEYRRQIKAEGKQMERELGPLLRWGETNPNMVKGLKERLKIVETINTVTFRKARSVISDALAQATAENFGVKETAELLKTELRGMFEDQPRFGVIARTETNAIHSYTRMDVMKEEGIQKVQWLTSEDELVREEYMKKNGEVIGFSHVVLDGQEVGIDEAFNNGEDIRFPLDPEASPGNTINCRCTLIATAGAADTEDQP